MIRTSGDRRRIVSILLPAPRQLPRRLVWCDAPDVRPAAASPPRRRESSDKVRVRVTDGINTMREMEEVGVLGTTTPVPGVV